jgi:cytochrome c oxidase subunit 2
MNTRARHRCGPLIAVAAALVTGCAGQQAVLDPAGPHAARIEGIWWVFLTVCAIVYLAVIAVLLGSAVRRRPPVLPNADPLASDPTAEDRAGRVVAAAVVATIVVLFGLALTSFATGRALSETPPGDRPVTIHVTGHQWWWEIQYEADTPANWVTTANELHVPVGRRIELRLTSNDVIHSFWAPNIDGKRDLIPGHITTLAFSVDRPGTYRAQCAEFCGVQHALMALLVVAEPQPVFDAWLARERGAASQPATAEQAHGRQVFQTAQCPMCHRIAGSDANGTVAPDLSHLASRHTLAAGTLPNTPGHLAGWIIDPQRVKPGVKMPTNELAPDDLHALLAYLDSLR